MNLRTHLQYSDQNVLDRQYCDDFVLDVFADEQDQIQIILLLIISVLLPVNFWSYLLILGRSKLESLKRNGLILDMVIFNHFYTTMNSVWASQMLMVMASLIHVQVCKMDQQLILMVVMSIVELRVPQSCATMELLKQHYLVFNLFAERTSGLVLLMKIWVFRIKVSFDNSFWSKDTKKNKQSTSISIFDHLSWIQGIISANAPPPGFEMIQPNMPVLDTCGSQDWKRHGNDMSPPADMFSSESQKYTTAIVFNGSGNECMGKCSDLSYNILYYIYDIC